MTIDRLLGDSEGVMQKGAQGNVYAAVCVRVRAFQLKSGQGAADRTLFVKRKADGVAKAKLKSHTLKGVEGQSEKYSDGLPKQLEARLRPLPFLYQSAIGERRFANLLDTEGRRRSVAGPKRSVFGAPERKHQDKPRREVD
jgi:hypothetical protein